MVGNEKVYMPGHGSGKKPDPGRPPQRGQMVGRFWSVSAGFMVEAGTGVGRIANRQALSGIGNACLR